MTFLETLGSIAGTERYVSVNACLTDDPVMIAMYLGANTMVCIALLIIAGVLFFAPRAPSEMRPIMKINMGVLFLLIAINYLGSSTVLFIGSYRFEIMLRGMVLGMSAIIAFVVLRDALEKEE